MNDRLLECAEKLYPKSIIDAYTTVCRTSSMNRKVQFLKHLDGLLQKLAPLGLQDVPAEAHVHIFRSWIRNYCSATSKTRRERGCLSSVKRKLHALGAHASYFKLLDTDYTEEEQDLFQLWLRGTHSASAAERKRWGLARMRNMQVFLGMLEDLFAVSGKREPRTCGKIPTHMAVKFAAARTGKRSDPHSSLELNPFKVELLVLTGYEGRAEDMRSELEASHTCLQRLRAIKASALLGDGTASAADYSVLREMLGADPWMAGAMTTEALVACFERYDPPAVCAALGLTWNHQQTGRKMFKLLGAELQLQGAQEKYTELRTMLPHKVSGLSTFDRLCLSASWRADVLQQILAGWRTSGHRSAYPEENDAADKRAIAQCFTFVETYAASKSCPASAGATAFHHCIAGATAATLQEIALAFMEDGNAAHRPDRIKSAHETHSAAKRGAMMIRFFKNGLGELLPPKIASTLLLRKLLRRVENIREPANPMARRTYKLEEIEAMLASCANDTKLTLLILLLSEVGLRLAALRHLRYSDLLDSKREPKHICSVMEKGRVRRTFVTSDGLKAAIRAHSLRAAPVLDDELSQTYVLSEAAPHTPVSTATIGVWLNKLARSAGITDVKVHPHAFRHTIVGRLMDAGNSLELVSKYMGHKSLDTTSTHYWVANIQELHETVTNPMTGAYQSQVRDEEIKDMELVVLRKKKEKAVELVLSTLQALESVRGNGGSAEDVVLQLNERWPNMAAVLRVISENES